MQVKITVDTLQVLTRHSCVHIQLQVLELNALEPSLYLISILTL